MKNWLQIAKEENEKFNNSDLAKLSDAKIKHLATVKENGINAKNSGQFLEFARKGGKTQGKIRGKLNVQSGHLANIRKLSTSKEVRARAKANTDYKAIAEKHKKPIYQFTMDGKFIKKYNSVKEAAEILGIQSSNITNAAKGRYKHYKKFIWKYKK
jgi:hypothetical protein